MYETTLSCVILGKIRGFTTDYFKISVSLVCLFWFCALYPARIGADYTALLLMIREGNSTDWWTGSYYWFLRITSLDGRFPEITSAFQIVIFLTSIIWFVNSLPGDSKLKRKVIIVFLCLPVFGFFGMTISHDLTQTAGIILLCGIEIRLMRKIAIPRITLIYMFGLALVLTTHSGLLLGIAVLLRTLNLRRIRSSIFILLTIVFFAFVTNVGLTNGLNVYGNFLKTSWIKYWPSVNVLKCITQHPEAEINPSEWVVLERLAPRNAWEKPVSCSDYDITVGAVGHANIVKNSDLLMSIDYLRTYLSVFSKNPAIGVMAHIQRARGVLPPILFQPPDNQVIWDVKVPIGLGTNTALQSGPELLHPSIDLPGEEERKPSVFNLLEYPAQGLAFVFNQASWFWGWGGLWLSIALLLLYVRFERSEFKRLVFAMYPALLIHLAYFYFIPTSLPRYYMFSICIGQVLLTLFLLGIGQKKQSRVESISN